MLHLHLTDDQGWRIASEQYPELHLGGGRGEGGEDEWYTLQELRDLCESPTVPCRCLLTTRWLRSELVVSVAADPEPPKPLIRWCLQGRLRPGARPARGPRGDAPGARYGAAARQAGARAARHPHADRARRDLGGAQTLPRRQLRGGTPISSFCLLGESFCSRRVFSFSAFRKPGTTDAEPPEQRRRPIPHLPALIVGGLGRCTVCWRGCLPSSRRCFLTSTSTLVGTRPTRSAGARTEHTLSFLLC